MSAAPRPNALKQMRANGHYTYTYEYSMIHERTYCLHRAPQEDNKRDQQKNVGKEIYGTADRICSHESSARPIRHIFALAICNSYPVGIEDRPIGPNDPDGCAL